MSVNERDLPQFVNGPVAPIGQINGTPVATKKQSSGLIKRIMANAKASTKAKLKGKGKAVRGRGKGIESDQKVHFKTMHRYY